MIRAFIKSICAAFISTAAFAEVTSTSGLPAGGNGDIQFNQNRRFGADTGNLTYSTATKTLSLKSLSVSTITINGQTYYFPSTPCPGGTFFKLNGANVVTCESPTSFVVSTGVALGVYDGGVNISTVTSDLNFNADQFIISLQGSTTASISLNPSSATLMGQITGSAPITMTGSVIGIDKSSVTLRGADPSLGGDLSGTISSAIVTDDSHNHTSASISGLDISGDTNLTVTAPIVLTGDNIGIDKSSATLLGPTIDTSELPALINATVVMVADDAYNATTWNGNTEVPTKNALRDKIESLVLSGGGSDNLGSHIATKTVSAPFGIDASTIAVSTITSTGNITLEASGDVGIRSWTPLRFYDQDNSNYIQFTSSQALSGNFSITLPNSNGSAGQAVVTNGAGVWSYQTISGGGSSASLAKFVLIDSGSTPWEVTVSASGALTTTSVGSIPAGVVARSSIVLQDANFGFWTVTVNTSGTLVTASGGSPAATISDLLLNDSTNKTWIVTVNTSGALVTS